METTGNSPVDRELGTAGRWRDAPVRVGRGQVQPAAAPLEASAATSHVLIYLKILSALQKSQSFGTVGEHKFFCPIFSPTVDFLVRTHIYISTKARKTCYSFVR